LILVDHGVKVIDDFHHSHKSDAAATVPACHTLDLKRVLHFSAEQCPAHMALEAINFLTANFTRYILKILSTQTQQ